MYTEPFADFSEYGDPSVEAQATEDPMVVVGEVLPSYYQWTLKLPEKVREGYLRRAYQALQGLSRVEIQLAAQQIAQREHRPNSEAIPWEIRRIASSRRVHRIDRTVGEKTVGCAQCKDTGLVHVYHPETVRWCDEGDLPPKYGGKLYISEIVVRCTCKAGDSWRRIEKYKPRWHVPVVFHDVPLDIALQRGAIQPVRLDLSRYKTTLEAVREGAALYEAELRKRRRQLGLPDPIRTATPLKHTVQEAIAQIS